MNPINPLLLDIPDQIQTRRMLLRAPHWGDGQLVNEAIVESVEELKHWMSWARQAPSREESEAFVRQSCVDWLSRQELQFFGFLGDKLVLGVELHGIDWNVPKFEIGYWARTSASGQGLVTEAVVSLTQFAFEILGAKRIQIRCNARNEASRRVALRAGFTQESLIKNNHRGVDNTLQDVCVFAITQPDSP